LTVRANAPQNACVSPSVVVAMLWLEAIAIAIGYSTLGAGRRPSRFGIVVVVHALFAVIAWWIVIGSVELGALLAARCVFAAEALAAWGLAALLSRATRDAGLATAISALVMVALAFAPVLGEAFVSWSAVPVTIRSFSFAACPPYAVSLVLGMDVLHTSVVYGRFPATAMEMHMTSWIWTTGAFAATGTLLAFVGSLRRSRRNILLVALALVACVGCKGKKAEKQEPAPAPPPAVEKADAAAPATPAAPSAADIDAAITKGIDFLAKSKGPNDWIGGHPGVTAMAALAMATSGVQKDDPRLAPLLAALAKLAKPNGSIFDKDNPVYVTAISALAFQEVKAYPELVTKAQKWLAGEQFGEKKKIGPDNVIYGGMGYGMDNKTPDADLSNLHFALDALKDAQLTDQKEVMARAQKFLSRCQNRTESNDQKWASNDGGFVYTPGVSKAGGTASTGSMTYAGIAGFLYTQADANDPRVKAALDYVRTHFSVDENPGLGLKGLYYNYHMMARALGLVGQRTLVDAEGKSHDWPAELATKLLSMQKPDGSWANTDPTYWENNPGIATSRAVLALAYARNAMK
jgi:squalene-hopene/tetraprenyl-beta-curcumene cyclase